MSYFDVEPTPYNLQRILGATLSIPKNGKINPGKNEDEKSKSKSRKSKQKNRLSSTEAKATVNTGTLGKAVRMWYILSLIVENSEIAPAKTRANWKEILNNIHNLTMPQLMYFDDPLMQDKCLNWKKDFNKYQGKIGDCIYHTQDVNIDELQPFSCDNRTIDLTFKCLIDDEWIIQDINTDELNYSLKKARDLRKADSENKVMSIKDLNQSESVYNFSEYIDKFGYNIRDICRFHIYSDYQVPLERNNPIEQIEKELTYLWRSEITSPICMKYTRGREEEYLAIAYPVAIHFYQRGYYLRAFGYQHGSDDCGWYNYRIDRIKGIEILNWDDPRINETIRQSCNEGKNDSALIDEVENAMEAAYGFDIEQGIKKMILRFERNFHDRYIEDVWRHKTFEQIECLKLSDRFDCLNPKDAYYTMNYYVDDNTVIMRLRAWGQNVEVLSPPELRQRMHDDLELTWAMYSNDPDPNSAR